MSPESAALQLAQAGPDAGASPIGFWLMMGALFLVMYALIIHPQRKQQKQHAKLLSDLKQGDAVVTSGGLHGRITGIADDVLTVEIANNIRVKMDRSAVSKIRSQAKESK